MPTSRVLPPIFFLGSILLMVLLRFMFPGPQWALTSGRAIGGFLLLLGILLNVMSARLFEKRGTAIKPFERSKALVVEGPYRFTRNPMYLGMLIILLGLGMLLGSTIPLLVIPVFLMLITTRFVLVEEHMLAERFGKAYKEYSARVRRWL